MQAAISVGPSSTNVSEKREERVCTPVDETPGKHSDRLVHAELPKLRPGRRRPRLEEDLGETQHQASVAASASRRIRSTATARGTTTTPSSSPYDEIARPHPPPAAGDRAAELSPSWSVRGPVGTLAIANTGERKPLDLRDVTNGPVDDEPGDAASWARERHLVAPERASDGSRRRRSTITSPGAASSSASLHRPDAHPAASAP